MGKRHAPAAQTPGKIAGTHCTRGWVGPKAGLNGCGISRPQIPKDQCIPPNRQHRSTLLQDANAAHCHVIPKQVSATLCQHKLLSHCANTQQTKRSIRNRPKYEVYLWGKSMPGAVRSKALICSRFISGVAGANPAEIISCVCCVGIGLWDRLINLTQLSYRECGCVCVCVIQKPIKLVE